MRLCKIIIFTCIAFFYAACSNEIDTSPKEIKYDREVCERCKMIISVRNYAAQTINPATGKRYYWDDIGCSILWFDEEKIDWEESAITYVKDVKTGKWLDAKKAHYTYGAITPMNFGYSAHEKPQEGVKNYDYAYVRDRILGKPL